MRNSNGQGERVRPWQVQRTQLVLDNPWARVRCDTCELPNGTIVPDYYYREGGDFAQVFAVTASDEVVLTRQYKHGVKEVVIELPAGLIDPSDATPLAAAQRELREETGYTAESWAHLGQLNVSSAKASTRASAFLAKSAKKTSEPSPDPNEAIEVSLATIDEFLDFISRGTIHDVNSIAVAFLALQALRSGA